MTCDDVETVKPRVAAVVVTYHPDEDVQMHLAALQPQVDQLIVVDNGSSDAAVEKLRRQGEELGFELIANGENLGVATALNRGAQRALETCAEWIFFFDQDSCVTDGFTAKMLAGYDSVAARRPLGILVPRYVDRQSGNPHPVMRLSDGSLITAITSGSLMRAGTFRELGSFADELFIDSVDHEYSFRVRRSGRILAECESAVLFHSLGMPKPHSLLGVFRFQSTNHSPVRRYYQERNKIWMYRHYGLAFPAFFAREFLRSFVDLAKLELVEREKWAKTKAFFRGVADGLRNRMGRCL